MTRHQSAWQLGWWRGRHKWQTTVSVCCQLMPLVDTGRGGTSVRVGVCRYARLLNLQIYRKRMVIFCAIRDHIWLFYIYTGNDHFKTDSKLWAIPVAIATQASKSAGWNTGRSVCLQKYRSYSLKRSPKRPVRDRYIRKSWKMTFITYIKVILLQSSASKHQIHRGLHKITRKLSYLKDDRVMRPM